MERFFFDIYDGGNVMPDEEGTLCADLAAAKAEAKASARDLAKQAIEEQVPPYSICVEIRDGRRKVLASLTVGEVLEHPLRPAFGAACSGEPCKTHR